METFTYNNQQQNFLVQNYASGMCLFVWLCTTECVFNSLQFLDFTIYHSDAVSKVPVMTYEHEDCQISISPAKGKLNHAETVLWYSISDHIFMFSDHIQH